MGSRLPHLLGQLWLYRYLDYLWLGAGMIGCIALVSVRPRFGFGMILLSSLVLFHSMLSHFQPSFAPGVPWLDYQFFSVSSNYCLNLARVYLENFCIPFFVLAGALVSYKDQRAELLAFVGMLLVLCLLINLIVIGIQGIFDLTFLAEFSGSAVSAGRAAGLLEDSGASNIIIGALLLGVLSFLFELKGSLLLKGSLFFLWFLAVLVGSYTGGRSFYALIIFGSILVVLLNIGWRLKVNRALITLISFVVVALGLLSLFLIPGFFQGSWASDSFVADSSLVRYFAKIDPIRAVHAAIFTRTIPEFWPLGIGLGGSHKALGIHAAEYEARGLVVIGDAPLNFFLALILELGLTGLLILVGIFVSGVRFLRLKRLGSDWSVHYSAWLLIGLSLFVAFFVGAHLIFKSFGSLLGFAAALALVVPSQHTCRDMWYKVQHGLLYITLGWLLGASTYLYLTPPKVTEFFWSKQLKPQTPLSLSVPIVTPGNGRWLPTGVPFALPKAELNLFFETPAEFYPVTIRWTVYHSTSRSNIFTEVKRIDVYDHNRPGQVLTFGLPETLSQSCPVPGTPEDYCYFVIETDPVWRIGGAGVGGYLLLD